MRVVGPWSTALDMWLGWLNEQNKPDNNAWTIEQRRSVRVAEVLNVMARDGAFLGRINLRQLRLLSSGICTHACT